MLGPLLDTSRRVRGNEHPRTLAVMNNLALVYGNQHRFEEATNLLREAIATGERTLGAKHPVVATYYLSLSEVTALRGSNEEALRLLREAVNRGFRDADGIAKDEDS